jgi:hypothetical protein
MLARLRPPQLRAAFLVLLAAAFSTEARADFFFHTWDDHHEDQGLFKLDTDLLYYDTSSNFDYAKATFAPSGFQSYNRIEGDLTGTYGINPWLSAYARVTLAKATVNVASSANISGFGDQTVGANARVVDNHASGFALDLQLQIDFPAYSNASATAAGEPFLGDGSTDVTFGGLFDYAFARRPARHDVFSLTGGFGYTYRTESFSSALPYAVDVKDAHDREGWLASVGFAGMLSLGNDARQYGTTDTYAVAQSAGTGGSFVTNAIDPTLFYIRGTVGYELSNHTTFTLTAMKAIYGQQSPDGTEIIAGAQFYLGDNPTQKKANQPAPNPRREVLEDRDRNPEHKNAALQDPAEYGHSNQGYVDYSLDAKVIKTNDRLNVILIDKGTNDGVEMGDTFDVFADSKDPAGGAAIARGTVVRVNATQTVVKITEYFQEVYIDAGATAKRPVK